jgi:hypothetical protein
LVEDVAVAGDQVEDLGSSAELVEDVAVAGDQVEDVGPGPGQSEHFQRVSAIR